MTPYRLNTALNNNNNNNSNNGTLVAATHIPLQERNKTESNVTRQISRPCCLIKHRLALSSFSYATILAVRNVSDFLPLIRTMAGPPGGGGGRG